MVMIKEKERYLLVGGTGFIGTMLAKKLLSESDAEVCVFSRSEGNQYNMKMKLYEYKDRISFFIGDIKDKESIKKCIDVFCPTVIVVSAAMKRIDVCEYHTGEAIKVNILGLENVCDVAVNSPRVRAILYTSTDKASDPVNVYGCTKSISERIMANYSYQFPQIKFCVTRYGNVLESTGSVVPIFRELIRQNKDIILRGNNMTRFILDEKQAVQTLLDRIYDSQYKSGQMLIPKCPTMRVSDLAEIMIKRSGKTLKISTVPALPCEKTNETLISRNESKFLVSENKDYYVLDTNHNNQKENFELSSEQNLFTKDELEDFLLEKNII
jgi:FlaA1/EpsC-like NDP-sugar epimerase